MSGLIKYLVVIEEVNTGYSAFSPDLPGCVATGSSKEEVEKNMKDAVAFHLEGMDQEGLAVPKPHSSSTYLEVPA
jgi:predicted RNase H-like HicB family nuclease